jgi:hypothetical protein
MLTISSILFLIACFGLAYIAIDIATDIARKATLGFSIWTTFGGPLYFTYIMGYLFIN